MKDDHNAVIIVVLALGTSGVMADLSANNRKFAGSSPASAIRSANAVSQSTQPNRGFNDRLR